MSRPIALDLCCKAGGASAGLEAAGFDVVGFDIEPQPNYPGTLIVGDVRRIEHLWQGSEQWGIRGLPWPVIGNGKIGLLWGSPPCQGWCRQNNANPGIADGVPDLVGTLRELFERIREELGIPWVIENVAGAPLREPVMLCGSMFADPEVDGELMRIERHRYFEVAGFELTPPRKCNHKLWSADREASTNRGKGSRLTVAIGAGQGGSKAYQQRVMGVDWHCTMDELSNMVPPAYAEWIGRQALKVGR